MSWDEFVLYGDLHAQLEINKLREHMEQMQNERDLANWDIRKIKEVADAFAELQLRHGLLVRLLIAKGVISAEEYASLIASTRPKGSPTPTRSAAPGDRPIP